MSGQMTIRRALGLLVSIFAIAAPRVAFAQAHLVKSVPSGGAMLASAPHTIQLWFSEAPEAALTTITLTAADGRFIQLGKVMAVPDTSVSVLAIVIGALAPGEASLITLLRTFANLVVTVALAVVVTSLPLSHLR